jgi:hypothetical protein
MQHTKQRERQLIHSFIEDAQKHNIIPSIDKIDGKLKRDQCRSFKELIGDLTADDIPTGHVHEFFSRAKVRDVLDDDTSLVRFATGQRKIPFDILPIDELRPRFVSTEKYNSESAITVEKLSRIALEHIKSVNGVSGNHISLSTDQIPEGSVNMYMKSNTEIVNMVKTGGLSLDDVVDGSDRKLRRPPPVQVACSFTNLSCSISDFYTQIGSLKIDKSTLSATKFKVTLALPIQYCKSRGYIQIRSGDQILLSTTIERDQLVTLSSVVELTDINNDIVAEWKVDESGMIQSIGSVGDRFLMMEWI